MATPLEIAGHDLDELRARLAAVADPLALLEVIFARSPFGLQIYRPDGHCVLVNPKFLELFGASCEVLVEALTVRGYVAEVVENPHQALASAVASPPDLAILDIGLPEMDGYELARRLRAAPALGHLRLVALTGYGQPADRDRALAAGFDRHLAKPIGIDTLGAVLAELLAEPTT